MFEVRVDDNGAVMISGELTIGNVEALHKELLDVYDAGICTVIDCSGVTGADTAALQVIAAFKRALGDINRPVACIASPAMLECLALAGMKHLLKVA